MSCFQLIKIILDDLYSQIPGDKDAKIQNKLNYLSDKYKRLKDSNEEPIDYAPPETRFAYVFRYVPISADFAYQFIKNTSELRGVFDKPRVEVACIGGGPGSDVVSILKYLNMFALDPDYIGCDIYDGESAWHDTWRHVDQHLDISRFSASFVSFDVTDEEDWSKQKRYLRSDLFTLLYFMSEVFRFKEAANPYFEYLFSRAKPGAMFLYVDNHDKEMTEWFEGFVRKYGYEIVNSGEHNQRNKQKMGSEEEKTDLGEYIDKFGKPRVHGAIDYRVCRKREPIDDIPFYF